MSHELEESVHLMLDFGKLEAVAASGSRVVPVVVQNFDNGMVVMLGYANEAALRETQKRGQAVFWSTSRNELWIKGAGSGDVLEMVEIRINCEQNSLLYLVRLKGGGACHTKDCNGQHRPSCYYRRVEGSALVEPDMPPCWASPNG